MFSTFVYEYYIQTLLVPRDGVESCSFLWHLNGCTRYYSKPISMTMVPAVSHCHNTSTVSCRPLRQQHGPYVFLVLYCYPFGLRCSRVCGDLLHNHWAAWPRNEDKGSRQRTFRNLNMETCGELKLNFFQSAGGYWKKRQKKYFPLLFHGAISDQVYVLKNRDRVLCPTVGVIFVSQ